MLTSLLNLPYEVSENKVMKRQEDVPIDVSKNTAGMIVSRGGQEVISASRFDFEFQPGLAGQFHFRPQKQPPVGLEVLDPPEVDNIVDLQAGTTLSASRSSHSQQKSIDSASQSPHPIIMKPTLFAANPANRTEQRRCILGGQQRIRSDVFRRTTELVEL